MDIVFVGKTMDVVGKVLIAYTAIMVHHRFRKEHKIDKFVFDEMKKEQSLGIVGIALIILGYLFEISPNFL